MQDGATDIEHMVLVSSRQDKSSSTPHASSSSHHQMQLLEASEADSLVNPILIVDDCPFNQLALSACLEQFGLKADLCSDGLLALQRVKARIEKNQTMFQLILMDFSMPECDGPTSTTLIREFVSTNTRAEQPFICFVTAYSEKSFKGLAKQAGSNHFLVKPIFKTQLHKVLIKAGMLS